MHSRFLIQLFLVVILSAVGVRALTCRCDDGADCKSGSCDAVKMWHSPEHCQTFYDPNANGGKSRGGCSLTNFHCDIVSQNQAVEATFKKGQLSSFGGCCGEERCNENAMESTLAQVKNASCGILSMGANSLSQAPPSSSFSCHCTPEDMITLFDLSVDRGVQWLPSATNSSATNASAAFDSSASLRQQMSSFCKNSMCNLDAMASAGISAPANAFGVCANYFLADQGPAKAIRGCTFVPSNPPSQGSANDYLQSRFPPTPVSGTYDVRVGVNMSERYPFIFECRSDNCNEQQFYSNVLEQCLPGVESSSAAGVTNEQAGGSVNPLGVPFPAEVPSATGSNATGSLQPGMGEQSPFPPEVPPPDSTLTVPGAGVEGVMPPLPEFPGNGTAPETPFGVGPVENPFTATGNETVMGAPEAGGNVSNAQPTGMAPEPISGAVPLSPELQSNNTFESGVVVATTTAGGIESVMQPGEGNASAPQQGMGNVPEGSLSPFEGTETNVPLEPVGESSNNSTAESAFIPFVPEAEANGTVPSGGIETGLGPEIVPEMPTETSEGNGTETNVPLEPIGESSNNSTAESAFIPFVPESEANGTVPSGGIETGLGPEIVPETETSEGNGTETNVPLEPVGALPNNGTIESTSIPQVPEANGTAPSSGGVETGMEPGIVPEMPTETSEGNGTETNVPLEPVAASPGNGTAESTFIPFVPEANGTVPSGGVEPGIVPEMPTGSTEGNGTETNVPVEPVGASPSNGTVESTSVPQVAGANGAIPLEGVETTPGIVPGNMPSEGNGTTTILEPGKVQTTAQGGNETETTTVASMEGAAAGNATGNATAVGRPQGAPSTGGAATTRFLNILCFAPVLLFVIFQ